MVSSRKEALTLKCVVMHVIIRLPGISERRVLSPSKIASTIAEIIVLTAEKDSNIQQLTNVVTE